MSYTPMSDLGQQGLFDITRTLLQQPDLASLCEALSQLVKRSALADNAAIVLWQAQTQRASYYASREKDTPIKYEDETVLAHGPVRSILSRPDTLHCSYEEFCETWPQLATGGLYPKFGHYCLMPLAAEGHIFGGCEFIRYDDRPWSEKEFNRLQTFTQIVSVVTEQIQSRVVNNVDYELLCRERDNFRIPAWIWTNWSAKSPKKSTTTSTLTISASSYAATVKTNSTSTPLTILINSIPLTNRAKSMKPEPSPNASSKVKRCC